MKKIIALAIILVAFASAAQKKTDQIAFVAFGDMPYHLPQDFLRFERLLQKVNEGNQLFNIHVGDIKSSSTVCSEAYFQKIISYFNQFKKPLLYTPGDNEWTDCGTPTAGGYDPEERLEIIRKVFFPSDLSLGEEKMKTTTQSQNPVYSKFVENRRWQVDQLVFGTLHVVGSNNNFSSKSKNLNREFFERNAANLEWLKEIFDHAKKINGKAVVIFMQADMFDPERPGDGFDPLLKALRTYVSDFKKTVILVHGDSHKFVIDKPLVGIDQKALLNFTRVQVFGEDDIHAVKISIDTATGNFQVEQIIVPEN